MIKKQKLSPYQRIMRNAEKNVGVSLSPEEVMALANDSAIQQVAWDEDERDEDNKLSGRS